MLDIHKESYLLGQLLVILIGKEMCHDCLSLQKKEDIAFEKKGMQSVTTTPVSQRSLHNAPIFRLLLKVAVNGTHQCDSQ